MLFRIDPVAWCPATALPQAVVPGDVALAVLLVALVWAVIGLIVGCVDYWSLDDDEVAEADPLDGAAWARTAVLYLVGWPHILYLMWQESADRRLIESYRSVGGQGGSE